MVEGDGDCDRWRHEWVVYRTYMATCEARWIGDEKRAKVLLSAIAVDDPEMFDANIRPLDNGEVELVITVTAESIPSLQSIMDDLLACLSAAETSLDSIRTE